MGKHKPAAAKQLVASTSAAVAEARRDSETSESRWQREEPFPGLIGLAAQHLDGPSVGALACACKNFSDAVAPMTAPEVVIAGGDLGLRVDSEPRSV